jgi:hypothetical protein
VSGGAEVVVVVLEVVVVGLVDDARCGFGGLAVGFDPMSP